MTTHNLTNEVFIFGGTVRKTIWWKYTSLALEKNPDRTKLFGFESCPLGVRGKHVDSSAASWDFSSHQQAWARLWQQHALILLSSNHHLSCCWKVLTSNIIIIPCHVTRRPARPGPRRGRPPGPRRPGPGRWIGRTVGAVCPLDWG